MSVADANRLSALEARIAQLEAAAEAAANTGLYDSTLEARFAALDERIDKLMQRVASLQGTLNAMRGRAVIPDAPVSHAASG